MTNPTRSNSQRFWGDAIPTHIPKDGIVQVDEMHEGIILRVEAAPARAMVFLSVDGARELVRSLEAAIAQWEED